jgi:hypothetical protein
MLIRNIFLEKEEYQDDGCLNASVMVDCRVSTINTPSEDTFAERNKLSDLENFVQTFLCDFFGDRND